MNAFGRFLNTGAATNSNTNTTQSIHASIIGPPAAAATTRFGNLLNAAKNTLAPAVLAGTSAPQKPEKVNREGQNAEHVYEYDRVDGAVLRPSVDPKRYGDASAAIGQGDETFPSVSLDDECEWTSGWEVDLSNWASVDKDGWTYGADWNDMIKLARDELSHATKHPNDTVRRRRHVRYWKRVDDNPEGDSASNDAWSENHDSHLVDEDNDDPFSRTAQKKQSGFRTAFAARAGKDYTKDYNNISDLNSLTWLVNANEVSAAPTDEAIREKTANLEERIKEASEKSAAQEEALRLKHQKKAKEVATQQRKLSLMIEQYRKVKAEHDVLQANAGELARVVEQLRKEATEKDILANEDQRAINAEMQAANQALEEKAKALATARIRYKRDNKSLAAAIQAAKQRLEQQEAAKAAGAAQDPVAKELEEMVEKLTKLHAKVEAVKQHRLAIEEERKEMYSQVVEKKSDMRLQSKLKVETSLADVDAKLTRLKQEQESVIKSFATKPEGKVLEQLNKRRNEIRNEMSALKERRMELTAKQRQVEL
ncbi:Aste57867_18597 [Aphanomyces stellatus]|uniref:Aste57867_18597 protein n=1 Tax=Aphanomyces stellatus TaxID=120398 RepID=A0A485LB48_9STRA|nr:hypothetical protein As57867_018535 [Aphanomyces stellatus]VFT95332.1 Aste57867_18597 [Aphanomyces stellatus]